MKLLFDQNLSPRLPRLLADIYAASIHVREIGLRDADDLAIWQYAKAEAMPSFRKIQISNSGVCFKARHLNSFGCAWATALSKPLKIY
jgi:hypothetical protein